MKKILTAIRENTSTIVSFLAAQLGMMVFGLVVMSSCISLGITWLTVAASVFTIGFYLALIYNKAWLMGGKDRIRIDGGRLEPMPLKGLLVSAVANLLNILAGIIANIGFLLYDKTDLMGTSIGNQMYYIAKAISRFVQSIYIGVLNLIQPYFEVELAAGTTDIHPVFLLLIVLPSLLAATAGYLMGSHNLRSLGFFGIKQMNVNEDRH